MTNNISTSEIYEALKTTNKTFKSISTDGCNFFGDARTLRCVNKLIEAESRLRWFETIFKENGVNIPNTKNKFRISKLRPWQSITSKERFTIIRRSWHQEHLFSAICLSRQVDPRNDEKNLRYLVWGLHHKWMEDRTFFKRQQISQSSIGFRLAKLQTIKGRTLVKDLSTIQAASNPTTLAATNWRELTMQFYINPSKLSRLNQLRCKFNTIQSYHAILAADRINTNHKQFELYEILTKNRTPLQFIARVRDFDGVWHTTSINRSQSKVEKEAKALYADVVSNRLGVPQRQARDGFPLTNAW